MSVTEHNEVSPSGRQFQNDVAGLFQIAGYQVQQDILVGHKKVDILVSEWRFGKQDNIAVECKDWNRTLTLKDVKEIFTDYQTLADKGLVSEILLVTKRGIADAAKAMVLESSKYRHSTYLELQASIMDFRSYLNGLVDQYQEDGLDQYYVPPRATLYPNSPDIPPNPDRERLFEALPNPPPMTGDQEEKKLGSTQVYHDLDVIIETWLSLKTVRALPVAILGSYGLGKTTFARHIAWKYASHALKDPAARIPVLVPLGEIATEQGLEGLLGKLFTATNIVSHYNFAAFLNLNKLGRFVIIFDGFDEMKHALSWAQFRYNLRQLNRLVEGDSKVMILGRPTAFLTDDEQKYALHGLRRTPFPQGQADPEWPDYAEINLTLFTNTQIETFLRNYLRYLIDHAPNVQRKEQLREVSEADINYLVNKTNLKDILKRPVQLKMLTEILPIYQMDELADITVNELYNIFIRYVIERESERLSRQEIKPDERLAFARDVAFWLWSQKRETTISEQSIPESLVLPYCNPGQHPEDVKRGLVAASILDRRPGERLFFPHRSFQEFLVAQVVHDKIVKGTLTVAELSEILSQEMVDFLEGFMDERFLRAFSSHMSQFRGALPLYFLTKFAGEPSRYKQFASDNSWGQIIWALAVNGGADESELTRGRDSILNTTGETRTALSAFFAALIASRRWRNPPDQQGSRMIGEALVGLCRRAEALMKRAASERNEFSVGTIRDLIKSMSYREESEGKGFTIVGVYPIVKQQLDNHCMISDWVAGRDLDYKEAQLPSYLSSWTKAIGKKTPREFFDGVLARIDQHLRRTR